MCGTNLCEWRVTDENFKESIGVVMKKGKNNS
jgi:hypothetical protein